MDMKRFKDIYDVSEILELDISEVNDKDDLGNTRLHVAMSAEVVDFIVTLGGSVHSRNNLGQTPLNLARSPDVVKKLIFFYADVDAGDDNGSTLLHTTESKDIVWALIEYGADVNNKDYLGRTPLHTCRNSQIARILMQNEAEFIRNDNEDGPVEYHRKNLKKITLNLVSADLLEFQRIISILSVISLDEEPMVYLDMVVSSLLRENIRLTDENKKLISERKILETKINKPCKKSWFKKMFV